MEELKKEWEELTKKMADFGIKLEEYGKENKHNNKRWRAEKGEKYYLVGEFEKEDVMVGGITLEYDWYNVESNDAVDIFLYKTRNYFKTKEEAEEYREKLKTYYDLLDLADELNCDRKINWNDKEQEKYYIYYNTRDKSIDTINTYFFKALGQIYCLDENFLDIALERIGKDRLEKLFKEG